MLSDDMMEKVSGGVMTASDEDLKFVFGMLKGSGTIMGKAVTKDSLSDYLGSEDFWETYGQNLATDRNTDVAELQKKLRLYWDSI